MGKSFEDRVWNSADGLVLHFRDYPVKTADADDSVPILCLHGLTRNARDFAVLAEHLSDHHRIIVPDMRGRGESEYAADPASYTPVTYVADVMALLQQEGVKQFIAIGTSMGGLMTVMMAMVDPTRIAGAIINDIGPDIDPEGIQKIREYVGKGASFPSWMHAARTLQETHGASFPKFTLYDWLDMAKRGLAVQPNGRIAFDYDMKIAVPFNQDDGAAPPDLWPAWQALGDVPVLIVRGALSNILTEKTLAKMVDSLPNASSVTVDDVGHAPLLEEPEALEAIDRFLAGMQ